MKYIEFDFLPIKINRKYKIAEKENLNNSNIILFNEFKTTMKICRNWFDKISTYFFFDNIDLYDSVFSKLVSSFGEPNFISFSRLKTWKINDVYLSFGEEESKYNYSDLVLHISLIKPLGLMPYNDFLEKEKILKNIIKDHNVRTTVRPSVSILGEIVGIFESDNFQYSIFIKKNGLELYSHEKVILDGKRTKLVPIFNAKYKYKKETLKILIDSFFNYMEEYDSSL